MATVGRNDPCPCGSGKKYKKCHQVSDEAKGRELRNIAAISEWNGFHSRRLGDLLRGAADGHQAVVAAAEGYFAGRERPAHPLDDALFADHAYWDVAAGPDGESLGAAVELPADLASVGDTEVMRKALVSSYLTLVEITEVRRGKGFSLRDVLTGVEATIWDESLADRVDPMEVYLARRLPFTERPLLAPALERLYFHGRKKAVAEARAAFEAAALAEDDAAGRLAWLKAAAPRLVAIARAHGAPAPSEPA